RRPRLRRDVRHARRRGRPAGHAFRVHGGHRLVQRLVPLRTEDGSGAARAPLDPVRWVPKLRGPVLMQFADHDEHVSDERRERLAAAAPKGAEVRVYKAGHELTEESTRERLAWLEKVLRVEARSGA